MKFSRPNASQDSGYQVATRIAVLAGIVALVASSLLLYDYSRRQAKDPLEDPTFKTLKLATEQDPKNEPLKEQLRLLDLQLRREYFRQRAFTHIGGALLLFAVAVFLLAAKAAGTIRRRLPEPHGSAATEDRESRWTPMARWAVVALCVMLGGAAIGLSVTIRSTLYQDRQIASTALPVTVSPVTSKADGAATADGKANADTKAGAADAAAATGASSANATAANVSDNSAAQSTAEAPASDEEIHKMWPRFRGPDGSGVSAYANLPETWDGAAGTNVLWKVEVPLPGNNSPVIWGNRVFLSGADAKKREVYCFDTEGGKLLWQQEVPGTAQSMSRAPKVNPDTGLAASTLATDGRRVFAIFPNGDLAAFDMDGKAAWAKSLGMPESSYGYATSLCMDQNRLIVQFDQGSAKKPKSKLLAFAAATGEPVWQADREVPNSWSTPIVIRAGVGNQLITSADPWVISYNPADGSEIWRAKCLRTDIGPSPVFADGKVYVANDNAVLSAIRVDGKGDVTATHIVWRGEDGMPDTASPLATKEFVFLLASQGTLTCYDAEKGDMLWSEDVDGTFSASPGLAGNRLYLQSREGKAYIVEPDREKLKKVAEADLGEECVSSPAFQEGRIYWRGKDHLFCIGAK
jgi:outer membrane protein assembly factor BamB